MDPAIGTALGTAISGLFSSLLGARAKRQQLEYSAEKDKLDRQIAAQRNLQNLYTQGGQQQAGQFNNIVSQLSNIMGRVNQ